jgi:transposase
MIPYSEEVERAMKQFYDSLSEKDRRRYAGVEALRYGHGGREYIARVLGCSRRTVSKGAKEVSGLPQKEVESRIRQPGGGRKSYAEKWPEIDHQFLSVLHNHTAGDPMDAKVRWTNLTPKEIAQALEEQHGVRVSVFVVRKLLKKHGYRRRKAQKKATMKEVADRNEQFENIAELRAAYEAAGNPILSMDTKKKEFLGNLYREGHLYTLTELRTYDHDFNSFAQGCIIPHALYDLQRNIGYIQLGTSHDTSEFACDSFRCWWYTYGRNHYPHATSILVLCDGGGSNSSRHYLFKQDLQQLADEIGVEIRIAHYPPYTSKHNPIEHRLFPHVTRACQGVIFTSMELVKELMEKTHTQAGLKVFVHIMDKLYRTGRKVADDFKENMTIKFDQLLPKWNYTAVPNGQVI